MRIVVWLVEGTWQGCVDAANRTFPSDARFALLHVTPSDVTEAAEAAAAGLFGRGFPRHKPAQEFEDIADDASSALLDAASARFGRQNVELLHRRGRVEREVVRAIADGVDLLVAARDGDRSRLGPRSVGPATRFVVDHAPCAVLLVWPDEVPGIGSIPPPPHGHKR
jgi:nucleotide-binding universal stress UspA family protein